MLIEGAFFTLKIRRDLSLEQWADVAHALCRIAIEPYAPRQQAELRRTAILALLARYQGSATARAKLLDHNYASYLANGWPREQALEALPEPRSPERMLLHRIAKLSGGASLGWRRTYDIAKCPQD
jgi:hypothetical protein